MLKQCTVFLLLLAFMATTFSRAVIVADFYANQDYIAKYLCVYRNKPIMSCGGTCQLRKRLQNEDNQEKSNPERRTENKTELLFSEEPTAFLPVPPQQVTLRSYPLSPAKAPIDRSSSIFHPPGQAISA